jgi:16S rRNA C967 or C1407 C5-methylase (RsmB/RsmF family)/NOL1/NOP2/fmu family ribosome biogenesis protein
MMLPQEFRNRINTQKYIDADLLFDSLTKPSPASIRVNGSKMEMQPSASLRVPWCNTGFYLEKRPKFTLDPLFHSGCYYPQEASSMFLEEIFRQTAPDSSKLKVLDLCGAPGGKSTHLSSLIGSNGLLVANEVIRPRASVLAENLSKWGIANTIVSQNDPSAFGSLPGYFDMILVDAPCSGEGMFRNEVAVNEWSPENGALCSERQKRILMDVWPSLKEDGILVYSTCTFNPAENEENIKWLVSKKEAESIRLDISGYGSVTEIGNERIFGYGFHPGKTEGDGLFFSVIRKLSAEDRRMKRPGKASLPGVSADEAGRAKTWSKSEKESLVKYGENIISFPGTRADLEILSGPLRIIKAGTLIMTAKQNKYLPSHELALSQLIRQEEFLHIEVDLIKALSYLKRETLPFSGSERGWQLVTYNSVNLGFVNNIGNRLNNYFPVEWRIRMNLPGDVSENLLVWEKGTAEQQIK